MKQMDAVPVIQILGTFGSPAIQRHDRVIASVMFERNIVENFLLIYKSCSLSCSIKNEHGMDGSCSVVDLNSYRTNM